MRNHFIFNKELVLVVDDEENIRRSIKKILEEEGYSVETRKDGFSGLKFFKSNVPSVAIVDIRLPGLDGIAVLKEIKENYPTECIMISGYGEIDIAVSSIKEGAFDFIEKPFTPERLIVSVKNAQEKFLKNIEIQSFIDDELEQYKIIGSSDRTKKLLELIERASKSDAPVLVTGESGTGKELVAKNIHYKSKRALKPFVHINCAAIPDDLVESELFGHKKGAFTGAIEDKKGKFEEADTGTIFLDEIGDLSLRAQAKVLRVIENGEIQRLGESSIKKVDVRIISATNKDLKKEVEEGRFREDLYFRLNVIKIDVPSLNERKEDIPELVEFFSEKFSITYSTKKKVFSKSLLDYLVSREWKGNIRELKNFIERIYALFPQDKVELDDIYEIVDGEFVTLPNISKFKNYKDFLNYAEKQFITKKLSQFGWNITRTAKEIGMSRVNLMKKIKDLGIKTPWAGRGSLPPSAEEESPDSTGQGAP